MEVQSYQGRSQTSLMEGKRSQSERESPFLRGMRTPNRSSERVPGPTNQEGPGRKEEPTSQI